MDKCPECGASFIAHRTSMGSDRSRRMPGYCVCSVNNKRGSTICGNNVRIPMQEPDDIVLPVIERGVLTPERAERAHVLSLAFQGAKRRGPILAACVPLRGT